MLTRLVLVTALLTSASSAAAERPRLGVLIVVDQLSSTNFDALLPTASAGFRRLVTEGYRVHDVRYEAAPTVTAAGHATISTGAYPAIHGIVGNEWYDSDAKASVYACEDRRFPIVGREPVPPRDGASHARLKAGTLGDSLKATYDGAKVAGVSGKDRATILLAGGSADVALWLDWHTPRFVTSTLFAKELPAWAAPFNERLAQAIAAGLTWEVPKGLPLGPATERPFARDVSGFGRAFPHIVAKDGPPRQLIDQLRLHPIADRMLVDLALEAVKQERLGQDEVPDLLTVSFSAFDELAHAFGPDSPEIRVRFRELDGELGRLLAGLDQSVGRGRYVVALTSDHGGAPVPDIARQRGLDAGRVDVRALAGRLEEEADAALGPGDWFASYHSPGYFGHVANRARLGEAAGRLRAAARAVEGVLDLYSKEDLLAGRHGRIGDLYRAGLDPDRSPDFILLTRPYWLYGTRDAAGHGSPHLYDRSLPLVLFGHGVRRGHAVTAQLVDVAPTLAFLLGAAPPSDAQGRVLTEALKVEMR